MPGSPLANIVRALVDAGATPQMILAAVEASEANCASDIEQRRAKDAARQQRRRDKKAGADHVTSRDDTVTQRDGSFLSPSPTPPTTNLSPVTPYSPPLKATKTAETAPHDEQNPLFAAEQLWEIASKASRGRSGRPATRKATATAMSRGATFKALRASVADLCRTGGDHAKGLHRIIEGEHWREFMDRPQAPPGPITEAEQARRLQHFRDTREWKSSWGERPKEAA